MRILDGGGDLNGLGEVGVHGVLEQLAQHAAQRLAGPRLGDHAFALDHAAEGRDGADLRAYEMLYFGEELGRGDGGGRVVGGGEGDEGEGEVAFEGCVEGGGSLVIGLVKAGDGEIPLGTLTVRDAYYAAFCDLRVGRNGLLDCACVDIWLV